MALVLKGGFIAFAGKIFSAVVRLVIAVVVARSIAVEQYGLYSLALSAITVVAGIALLGLDASVTRFVALGVARAKTARVWGALQVAMVASLAAGGLALFVMFTLAERLAQDVFHEPRLAPMLQLGALIVPLLTLGDVLASASRGFKKMHYSIFAQAFALPSIRLLLVATLALVGLTAISALAAYGIALLATTLLLLFFLHRQFPLRRDFTLGWHDARPMLAFSVPVWLSEMLIVFRGNIQALLLGTLQTVTTVAVFAIASQVMLVVHLVLASISTAAKPFVVELHHKGDLQQLGRLYQVGNKWSLLLNLPIFAGLVLFPGQVLSIFGEDFAGGAPALVVLAFAHLASVGTGMCGTLIDMTGHARLKLANSAIWLVVLITCNLLLIPTYHVVGAALSVLIGEAVVNLFRVVQVYRLFGLLPWNRSFIKPVIAVLAGIGASLVLERFIASRDGLPQALVHGVVIVLVYGALLLALGLSADERALVSRVRARLVRSVARA